MSDNDNSVWHWLESAGIFSPSQTCSVTSFSLWNLGLERFYNKFRAHGINENNFTSLQFQDYDAVGVSEHAERQKLFKLIQVVKRELDNSPNPSSSGPGTNRVYNSCYFSFFQCNS